MLWIKNQKKQMQNSLGASPFAGLVLFVSLALGCQSSRVRPGVELTAPADFKMGSVEAITSDGENWGGRFDPKGQRLIYISRERAKHASDQAYERLINESTDRRITHQDGQILNVEYESMSESPAFWYASTTDEIKENSDFLQSQLKNKKDSDTKDNPATDYFDSPLPGAEIYLATIHGREIQRWTNQTGFDGQQAKRPHRDELAFVSLDKNKTKKIFILNLKSKSIARALTTATAETYPAWSSDGKILLWSQEKSDDATSTEIWMKNMNSAKTQLIVSGPGHHLEPRFHPNGDDILFTSNRDDSSNYEIYAIKKDGSCLRRLTYNSSIDRTPDVSPDGGTLIFSSYRSGKSQIYRSPYSPPPCPAADTNVH